MARIVLWQNSTQFIGATKIKGLADNFLFSNPPQFHSLLKYWGYLKNFHSDTTNCGVDGKNSPSTPQIVLSMAKIHLRHHILWCRMKIFAIDTTICGVEGGFLPATPQFVVSELKFFKCLQYSYGG